MARSQTHEVDAATLLAHGNFVRAVARKLLRHGDQVDDVVQETWLRALRSPPARAGALRAWLGRVARNLARDRLRRDERRLRRERRVARPETVPPDGDQVARLQAIVNAVAALEEPYRSTVLMRFYENQGPTEIAARHGLPVATVKSRLRRALELMRADLAREHGGARGLAIFLLPLFSESSVAGPALAGGMILMQKKLMLVALVLALGLTIPFLIDSGPEHARDGSATREAPVADSSRENRDAGTEAEKPEHAPGAGSTTTSGSETATGEAGVATGGTKARKKNKPRAYRVAEANGTPDQASLRVVVVEEDGPPVAGAKVSITLSVDGVGQAGPSGTTDATGTVEFDGLDDEQVIAAGASAGQFRRSYQVRAADGHFTELTIVMPKGVEVSGVVRHAAKGPLQHGIVQLMRRREDGHDYVSGSTDSKGRYAIPRVPPGEWEAKLHGAGLEYHETQRGKWQIEAPGPVVRDIVVGRLSLTGTVRDARTGAPIADAEVQAQQPKFASTRTNKLGVFEFYSLPAGKYSILVRIKGYAHRWFKDVVIPEHETGHVVFEIHAA
ncbi:MAG: sigma-70 family RNA polymerase sigma factor, partial [Planctomycetota bacterium]|nr:sigma-70 family RNA polymerase sigma factor [Planctomycetota bacterium]